MSKNPTIDLLFQVFFEKPAEIMIPSWLMYGRVLGRIWDSY
ncbi:unnamed protein product [Moneuplotes crassus]|uniref:Uncharacterized protein n=1 Tax=Euplotes crassus TaxID=5936 RepID=A0AAD1Y1B9_EUPCR|nr:unnamed protein product [Moneuplotes crassus]